MTWLLTSRRRVLLIGFGLLLLLDGGRSAFTRIGYAQPAEPWQEAPYEDLTWHPGADLQPGASLGETVYVERCAVCHGLGGEGNGPAAPSMIPRPRDFIQGAYKYKSTPVEQPPTDDDLKIVVANGLQASAMPYWNDILSDDEIDAVVGYIKDMSPVFEEAAPETITIPQRVKPDAASIATGEELYTSTGCIACHGADGRGNLYLTDSKAYPVVSRDLTAPWTFRGGSDPEQLWLRLTTGLAPGPMPSFADTTTSEERWHLVNYVVSISRRPPVGIRRRTRRPRL